MKFHVDVKEGEEADLNVQWTVGEEAGNKLMTPKGEGGGGESGKWEYQGDWFKEEKNPPPPPVNTVNMTK